VVGALLVLAAACGRSADGGAAGTAPSTSSTRPSAVTSDLPVIGLDEAILRSVAVPHGSYTRSVLTTAGDEELTMMVHDVHYVIDTGFTAFTVRALVDEHGTPIDAAEAERFSLRYINTPERSLMRHPLAEESCGAPWVELPRDAIAASVGVDPALLFAPGKWPEPFTIIDLRTGQDEVLVNDTRSTIYGIEVPASTGMSLAALERTPETAAELDAMTTKAVVHVGRQSKTIDLLEVVLSDEVAAVLGADAGTGISFRWEIDTTSEPVDQTLPSDIAPAGCFVDEPAA